ncbi:MAG TPA: UDP-N-acetylglucosamine 1-carboxyvinyltransferase [Chloroflexota bacterium]|jgi:UDP-N-acetylglucosamine 1-carboxyvinyltransferase|nr:UDP-N-acetylglucosamine 1-carboxyvinyltransferase [Chloroflexota bacterium]
MSRYVVTGGVALRGTVEAAANKNAVLPIMAATLLTDEQCVLTNVPQITDVIVMGNLLRELGARVEGLGSKELRICCAGVRNTRLDPDLVRRMRAAVTLIAPLLARYGHVRTSHPGGCLIGRRDIGTHLNALTALGAQVIETDNEFDITAPRLTGAPIFLDEASVTATENTVMAACLAEGQTSIKHAACEPHVEDVCRFLQKMGARIKGIGSNVIRVEGVSALHGVEHQISTDHVDVGTFAVAAALTGGEITIRNFVPEHFEMVELVLRRMGVDLEIKADTLIVHPSELVATRKIATDPWPGFPTDLASVFIVLATQAAGTTLVHDWMYEGRMFFTDKLVQMGANIVLCDPHRCVVTGPTHLRARTVYSPDLRAGAALVLAALTAEGMSEIHDIEWVERGYENFVDRLSALGARIEKVD